MWPHSLALCYIETPPPCLASYDTLQFHNEPKVLLHFSVIPIHSTTTILTVTVKY